MHKIAPDLATTNLYSTKQRLKLAAVADGRALGTYAPPGILWPQLDRDIDQIEWFALPVDLCHAPNPWCQAPWFHPQPTT